MRKITALILSVLLISGLFLTACQNGAIINSENNSVSESVSEADNKAESEKETEIKETSEKTETEENKEESVASDETEEKEEAAETRTEEANEKTETKDLSSDVTADVYLKVTNPEVLQVQVDENGVGYHNVPTITSDMVEFKNIGDTFKGWVKIEYDEENKSIHGYEGIYFTLNSVELYESVNDAELDPNGRLLYESYFDENNMFILCDVTAKYIAPEGGEKKIICSVTELEGAHLEEINKETETGMMIPLVAYCSDLPKGDSELLLNSNQGFRFQINDGESITFQIGIIANRAYVESKNVFLSVNYVFPTLVEDFRHKYFVIFPEE